TINEDKSNEMSMFPVQSSLAMHLAEKALAGCVPVVVLNEQDQYYLSLIKNILVAKGKMNVIWETLVFSTGPNGIDAAAETFAAGADLPVVLLTADEQGEKVRARLLARGYKDDQQKVMSLTDFVPGATTFEDIIPANFVEIFSRLYLAELLGNDFQYDKTQNLLQQIEEYAAEHEIELPFNYRSELAKRMKLNTMRFYRDVRLPRRYVLDWINIWHTLLARS
ncbi:MAG: hypothetical protein LBM78_00650, partial [Clostridiales bacterium]|nr:hypothetical protein [Clostridiales bacterium]